MDVTKENFTIVQLTVMDETGDSYYRMRWPAAELSAQAPGWRIINLDARAAERFQLARHADLLVLYQCADLELLPIVAERRARGLKTLVEYNDNFYAPPPASPVAREWSSPLLWQSYEACIDEADALLVTGPGLHELFSQRVRNRPIHILENHLPSAPKSFEELQKVKTPYPSFGWAGSLGHISDLLALVPTFHRTLKEFPQSKLHLMGNESIPSLVKVPPERLVFSHWGTIHEYYEFWKPVHIGVAPLLDTPYNRCRSDIKAVEMGALGVAPLLSEALPYHKFCENAGATPVSDFREFAGASARSPTITRCGERSRAPRSQLREFSSGRETER